MVCPGWEKGGQPKGIRLTETNFSREFEILGPVDRTPVSTHPGLNNILTRISFFSSKVLSRIISSVLFRVSSHQMVGKEN